MDSLFQELKRRKVFRVGAAYAIVAWLLVQVVGTVLPTFDAPEWVQKSVVFLLLIGFPVALLLAWALELTPDGIKVDSNDADREESENTPTKSNTQLGNVLLGIAFSAVLAFSGYQYLGSDPTSVAVSTQSTLDVEEVVDADQAPVIEKSVAVLPFVSISQGEEDGYFADGLTEELLNVLTQISDLKVTGRASSFYYKDKELDLKEIGETLGVAHLLEGSVRRSGDQLRITAQLVDVSTGFHLWSDTFDRNSDDVFAIQDEIAQEVTAALRVEILGEEAVAMRAHGTGNAEARSLYLIALPQLREAGSIFANIQGNPEPARRIRELLEEAVRLDPNYSEAWAALVYSYLVLFQGDLIDEARILLPMDESLRLAEQALERATALSPNSPFTLVAKANLEHARYQRTLGLGATSLDAVLLAYDRALEAAPDNLFTVGNLARFKHFVQGKNAEALELYDRVLAKDPLSLIMLDRATLLIAIDPPAARQQYKRIGDLYPASPWQSGIAGIEYGLGHLHHAILWEEASLFQTPLAETALISLGDEGEALGKLNLTTNRGGSLGLFARNTGYFYRRDYQGLIASASGDESESPEFVFKMLGVASFKLRKYDDAIRFTERWFATQDIDIATQLADLPYFLSSVLLELAHAYQEAGNQTQADAIRAHIRDAIANNREARKQEVAGVDQNHFEWDLLLLASEGRVDEALTAFEALTETGWHWLMSPSPFVLIGHLFSNSHQWFEDNPLLDSIRDEPRFIAALNKIKAENAAMLAELLAGLTIADIIDER